MPNGDRGYDFPAVPKHLDPEPSLGSFKSQTEKPKTATPRSTDYPKNSYGELPQPTKTVDSATTPKAEKPKNGPTRSTDYPSSTYGELPQPGAVEMTTPEKTQDQIGIVPVKEAPLARTTEIVKYNGQKDEALKKTDSTRELAIRDPQKNELAIRKADKDKPKLTEMHMAVVSTVQHGYEITFKNATNKEVTRTVKSKDVITQAAERFSYMKMSETANKREDGLVQTTKTYLERFWRGTMTKGIHEKKEKFHGIDLMAAAGIETGITAEFDAEIDKRAREKIDKDRASKTGGTFFGALRDFGNELIGRERDLHREKVVITAELRAQYLNNPADETNPIFALLKRDSAAREALAQNVMDSPVDFLHAGDKKTTEFKVAKDSTFDKFLKEQVLIKIKDDVIDQVHKNKYNGRISEKTRVTLDQTVQDYFFSDEFTAYRKTLSAEDQKLFENSFTYATNILSQAEQYFVPLVHDNLEQYKTWQAQDMDIYLTLGTAQLGPRGEIKAPSVFDKERVSANEATFDRMRELRRKSKNHNAAGMYDDAELNAGIKREFITAAMNDVASGEKFAAVLGAIGGKALLSTGRASLTWIPIVGTGLIAGGLAGAKEFKNTTELRGQWLVEAAEGYEHPSGANAVRAEKMRKHDYYRMGMDVRINQLLGVAGELSAEAKPAEEKILLSLAYLADSKARIALGDKGGYSLFTASKDHGEGRGIFQAEETLHNKARTIVMGKLESVLNGANNQELRSKIATAIGANPDQMKDTASLVQLLASGQEQHLKTGTKVSEAFMAVMGRDQSLIIDEARSIDARDETFNKYRWVQAVEHGATTGVFAGLFAFGGMHFKDLHTALSFNGSETGPVTLLEHDYPLHVVGLPNNAGDIINPANNEVIDHTFTHIPTGTHWAPDATTPNAFDLVLEKDGVQKILLNDATFTADHHLNLTSAIKEDIAHNHLSIDHIAHDPISLAGNEVGGGSTVDTSSWTHTMAYKDFPGQDLDAHYAQTFHASVAANPDMIPEGGNSDPARYINAMRFLHRAVNNNVIGQDNVHLVENGYDRDINFGDSMYGSEYLVKGQPDNAVMTNLPSLIATQEGNAKFYKLVSESLQQGLSGEKFSDPVHEVVFHMAHEGTEDFIPDKVETNMILDYLGENVSSTPGSGEAGSTITPHDLRVRATEDITVIGEIPAEKVAEQTIWNPAILLIPTPDTLRPLEAPEVKESKGEKKGQDDNNPPSLPPTPTPSNPGTDITLANQNNNSNVPPAENVESNVSTPAIEVEQGNASEVKQDKVLDQAKLKEYQATVVADVLAEIDKNPETKASLIADPTSAGTIRNISSVVKNVANQHNLPMAYIVRDGRVRLLTKPPTIIDNNKSVIHFYNPETGKEDSFEMFAQKSSSETGSERLSHSVFFTDKANFPTLTSPIDVPIADPNTVQAYLTEAGYNYSGFTDPEAKPFNPDGNSLWLNDITKSIAFIMATQSHKDVPPASPEATPPAEPISTPNTEPTQPEKAYYSPDEFMNELNTLIKSDVDEAASMASWLEPTTVEDLSKPEKLENLRKKYEMFTQEDKPGAEVVSSVLKTSITPSQDLGEKLRIARARFDEDRSKNPEHNKEVNEILDSLLKGMEKIQQRLDDARARGIRPDETLGEFDARMEKAGTRYVPEDIALETLAPKREQKVEESIKEPEVAVTEVPKVDEEMATVALNHLDGIKNEVENNPVLDSEKKNALLKVIEQAGKNFKGRMARIIKSIAPKSE